METKTLYNVIKKSLSLAGDSTAYFTPKTLDTIMADRICAAKVAASGGDTQEFWRASDSEKTDFYIKNSCAFCSLQEILSDLQKVYSICVLATDCIRSFHFRIKADSLEHAKYLSIAKAVRENTDIYGEITAEEEVQ